MRHCGKYGKARQTTDDNITMRMRFASWVTKATNTHSECAILIVFQQQLWLSERASMLRYTHFFCLFIEYGYLVIVTLTNSVQHFSVQIILIYSNNLIQINFLENSKSSKFKATSG
jgi:hypothetical protein